MNKKVRVIIERGPGAIEAFDGKIVSQTTAGYYVAFKSPEFKENSRGEWFPKTSQNVRCLIEA